MSLRPTAFFDLDGTLLADDTQLLFYDFLSRREPIRRLASAFLAPFLPLSLLGYLGAGELKRVFLSYLWRLDRDEVLAQAETFADEVVAQYLYPEVVAEVARHRAEGRVLVLNSASPAFYVEKIGHRLGFDHSFGTPVIITYGPQPLIADFSGPNNKCDAKLPPMQRAGLLPCQREDSWAYTDSTVDLPLLGLAQHGVVINPSTRLTALAQEKQWTILRPARPWKNRIGHLRRVASLLTGLPL
jgi:HAD superfamily hydrolase (TIGR01490 family)